MIGPAIHEHAAQIQRLRQDMAPSADSQKRHHLIVQELRDQTARMQVELETLRAIVVAAIAHGKTS